MNIETIIIIGISVVLNIVLTALIISRWELKERQLLYEMTDMHHEVLDIIHGLSRIQNPAPEHNQDPRGKGRKQRSDDEKRKPIGFRTPTEQDSPQE